MTRWDLELNKKETLFVRGRFGKRIDVLSRPIEMNLTSGAGDDRATELALRRMRPRCRRTFRRMVLCPRRFMLRVRRRAVSSDALSLRETSGGARGHIINTAQRVPHSCRR